MDNILDNQTYLCYNAHIFKIYNKGVFCMNVKKIILGTLAGGILLSGVSAAAMTTADFDNAMEKGIRYFNRVLYYEARDEFQWFADYNWGALNAGQQQYLLDYLDGPKALIQQLEANKRKSNSYNISSSQAIAAVKNYWESNYPYYDSLTEFNVTDHGTYYTVSASMGIDWSDFYVYKDGTVYEN